MDKFNLEKQFKMYLEKMKLSGLKPESIQYKETKRAFMGACGQILVLMRDEITVLPEHKAIKVFESMWFEVGEFFENECK